MKKETYASRLGFIMMAAGCAVGLGNVWKFPYMCGANGGAIFILIYLAFLLLLGIPVLVCELAMGRATRRSIASSFDVLEPEGTKWHWLKWLAMLGNYCLMMFYTPVGGWMVYYCWRSLKGDFVGLSPEQVAGVFGGMLGDPLTMIFWTALTCGICFFICAQGLSGGMEKITQYMMTALLVLLVALAFNSLGLEGAGKGIDFYLVPNLEAAQQQGWGNVVFGALAQAFFTLSLGIGSMQVLGSYMDKSRSLTSEALCVAGLDTLVALMAGFCVIPACFAFGIAPGAGPALVFITLPNIFAQVPGGAVWNACFFLFLSFAACSTIIAVYENLISFNMELFDWSRKKSAFTCGAALLILTLPAILGFNVWSGFQPLGAGSCVLDLEDFIVSNNVLPLGALAYLFFSTQKNGWTWEGFLKETNSGEGLSFPASLKFYVGRIVPLIVIGVYLKGYYDLFSPKGSGVLCATMLLALSLLGLVFHVATRKGK